MGKTITIRPEDDLKLEQLKKQLRLKTKIEVVRLALVLLEDEVKKQARIKRWKKFAEAVGSSGLFIMKEFNLPNRFKHLP